MHRQNILRWYHILRKVREASASSSYTYILGKIWIRIQRGFPPPQRRIFINIHPQHYSHPPSIFTLCASLVKSYGCGPRVLHRRSKSSVAPAVGGRTPPDILEKRVLFAMQRVFLPGADIHVSIGLGTILGRPTGAAIPSGDFGDILAQDHDVTFVQFGVFFALGVVMFDGMKMRWRD